jgi:hypothetical protein
MDTVTLATPREIEVTNYGVKSTITITEATVAGDHREPENGEVRIRLRDFPEDYVTLWSGDEGKVKIAEGYTRQEALDQVVAILG